MTTFEDVGDAEARAKSAQNRHSVQKDGKGNVVVSVRVKPEAKDKQELEWEVDNKQSLISYKGKEGGNYVYGELHGTVQVTLAQPAWRTKRGAAADFPGCR